MALENSLSTLRAERTLIQPQLDSHSYPVLTLPTEIICEIFTQCLPVYPECPPCFGILSPTNLTHICRQWRDIVLATPALWRAMRLSSKDDRIPFVKQIQQLDIWLERSRNHPFSLEIEIDELSNTLQCDAIFSLVQCARLEFLKASLWQSSPVIEDGPIPLLRHLNLMFEYHDSPEPLVFSWDAPLLRSAILNDIAIPVVILPWAQLTELTLHRVFPEECVPVLQQTSNLVYCKLTLARSPGPWPDVTLLRLESLVLVPFNDITEVSGYLETFIVPALRHLQVEEQLLGSEPIDSLTTFMSKSRCQLEGMNVSGLRQLAEDVYRCAFPSIELSFGSGENEFDESDSDSE